MRFRSRVQPEDGRGRTVQLQDEKKQLEIQRTIKRLLLAVERRDWLAAEDRVDELEKLIPRDPRLAAWQETIEKLPRHKKEGPVEIAIRTADDRPAANAPVEISLARRTYPPEEPPLRRTTTDGQGVAHFSWPLGVTAVNVACRGSAMDAPARSRSWRFSGKGLAAVVASLRLHRRPGTQGRAEAGNQCMA